MPAAYLSSGTTVYGSASTTWTLTLPTVAAGDVLVLGVGTAVEHTISSWPTTTYAAGVGQWDPGDPKHSIGVYVVPASPPASITVTFSAAQVGVLNWIRMSGVKTSATPVDAFADANFSSGSPDNGVGTMPSINTTEADCYILGGAIQGGGGRTWTQPSGWAGSTQDTTAAPACFLGAKGNQASAGATGTTTISNDGTALWGAAWTLALKSAAASPDGTVAAPLMTATAQLRTPTVSDGSTPPEIDLWPAQPAALIYSDSDASSAAMYAYPGALIVAGRVSYGSSYFVNAAAAGATVLIYLDIMIDNNHGRYHDKLHNASEFGAAVPRWPGDWQCNDYGYLADFRVGGTLQSKLEDVLELMVAENPHMGGFFMDDLGTRSWFPYLDWGAFGTTNQAAYRAGAIAAMETIRTVADRYGLIVIVNGTWTGGDGGGYPTSGTHGCSLADGGFIENHSVDAFWTNYATSTQWGADSPIGADPIMWAESPSDPEITDWTAVVPFVSSHDSGYDEAETPWGSFHFTGLPTGVSASGNAGVSAVVATATAVAPVPSVSVTDGVTGVVATATATALAPSVAGGTGGAVVAVAATATLAALAPTLDGSTAVTVTVDGPALAALAAHAPVVQASEATGVLIPVATAAAVALAPTVEVIEPTYLFSPPTHEEPMRTNVKPLVYFRLTYAKSVVKINGTYTQIRTPAPELLEGLEEGVDYFLGGRDYEITRSTANALAVDGYTATEITD